MRTVIDWYRTGIGQPVPRDEAVSLLSAIDRDVPPEPNEIEEAFAWASTAVIGAGRKTRQSLITQDKAGGLFINDYLIDHDQRYPRSGSPRYFGTQHFVQQRSAKPLDTSVSGESAPPPTNSGSAEVDSFRDAGPEADVGDVVAMYTLGALFSELGPPRSRRCPLLVRKGRRRQRHGRPVQPRAPLAKRLDPPTSRARRWYTMAAEAGHAGAQCNLGLLWPASRLPIS